MNIQSWIPTRERYPESGQKVYWLASNGEQVAVVVQGRLWFFADMSMYVYYVPEFWRERKEATP